MCALALCTGLDCKLVERKWSLISPGQWSRHSFIAWSHFLHSHHMGRPPLTSPHITEVEIRSHIKPWTGRAVLDTALNKYLANCLILVCGKYC